MLPHQDLRPAPANSLHIPVPLAISVSPPPSRYDSRKCPDRIPDCVSKRVDVESLRLGLRKAGLISSAWPHPVLTSRSSLCVEVVDGERVDSLSSARFRHPQDFLQCIRGRGPAPPGQSWRVLMNSKMKTLSLAVLGFVGFGAAGAAMAQCPASLSPPWSSVLTLSGGTAASVAGGLDGSACKLNVSITSSTASIGGVVDNTPANETRYRFQFLVNGDGLGTWGAADAVQLFSANAAVPNAAGGGRRQVVTVGLSPGAAGAKRLSIVASNGNAAPWRTLLQTADLPAGVNRIEIDLTVGAGAAGQLKYWLNAPAGTTEGAATGTIPNLNNAGWVGVDTAALGLSAATPSYRGSHAGQFVSFDTFDSRRQTYIGH